MDSYWDLYVAYINHCVKYNWDHDIDPHHYEMEWNHFLPKAVFGDWPIGQYLLLKQHAVASALQSLAFRTLCHCGWHKKYMPEALWALCRVYQGSFKGKKHSLSTKQKISNSLKGVKPSEGTLRKMSKSQKEAKNRKYICLLTGRVSNDSGLTRYQQARGIDTSLRHIL